MNKSRLAPWLQQLIEPEIEMIIIARWDTGDTIHSGDFKDTRECLEDGVSRNIDFYRARLNDAQLNHAELTGAKLHGAQLNYAELNYAQLNGVIFDFLSWPLWCGTLNILWSDRIFSQLLYHLLSGDHTNLTSEFQNIVNKLKSNPECSKFSKIYRSGLEDLTGA